MNPRDAAGVAYLILMFASVVTSVDVERDVTKYELVDPIQINRNVRNRRDLSTQSADDDKIHFGETTFQIRGFGKLFNIHLQKNEKLLSPGFKVITQNTDGSHQTENEIIKQDCHYHGYAENEENSTVVMSTCNGLRGLIQLGGGEDYFIEPHQQISEIQAGKHVMYKMKDLKVEPGSCGHHDHEREHSLLHTNIQIADKKRYHQRRQRQSTTVWNDVETMVVVDKRKFDKWGGSVDTSNKNAMEIMNYVDAIYKTIQIRVAVIGLIVWDKQDMINISTSAGVTLNNFKKYSLDTINGQMKIIHDNAQLITGINFEGTVVGLAFTGDICSRTSAGVTQDLNSNPAIVANTLAHEIGHNLGFSHNTGECVCENEPCVMASIKPYVPVKGFSDCAVNQLNERANNRQSCIYDIPDKLFMNQTCGNGYLEDGEQCDCGTIEDCKRAGADKCCNATTCKLHSSAQCTIGSCCQECKFKEQGNLCRATQHPECDLEEYCTGQSPNCPRNTYIADGKACQDSTGLCFSGLCKTHTQQCETLWGETGVKAHDACFNSNALGNIYGNCGKKEDGTPIPCAIEDLLCGKIQCSGKDGIELPRWPLLGWKRGISQRFIGSISCKAVKMDFPKGLDDPTMTLDGTKCNDNSACIGNKCVNLTTWSLNKPCDPFQCHNGGVCNNNGNCHCQKGWMCPYCNETGFGGSLDSGQGCVMGFVGARIGTGKDKDEDNNLAYLWLMVIPCVVLIAIVLYMKKSAIFKATKHTRVTHNVTGGNSQVTVVKSESTIENPYV